MAHESDHADQKAGKTRPAKRVAMRLRRDSFEDAVEVRPPIS